jgi:hypothetical protein
VTNYFFRSCSCVTDLCDQCAEENLVFPSLEAFECGIACPPVHVIFYDWFLKSSVGDSAWKRAIYAKDALEPMSPIQGEAFAMILLKNNYFAWLSEAKMRLKELLVTEYDTKKEKQNKVDDAGLYFLRNCHLNFDIEIDLNVSAGSPLPDMDKLVLKPTNVRYAAIYQQVAKEHSEFMKTIAGHAAKNVKFKEMKKGLMQMMKNQRQREVTAAATAATPEDQSFDYGDEEEEEQEGDSPQRRKRRKLLKSFREYTSTANEEEGRFKGWSVRAGQDMGEYMTKWSAPEFVSRRQLFWMAYRETYKQKQERLGKKKKPATALPNPPNYQKNVWGFQDLPDQIVNI